MYPVRAGGKERNKKLPFFNYGKNINVSVYGCKMSMKNTEKIVENT
jgi:hypothetical protein